MTRRRLLLTACALLSLLFAACEQPPAPEQSIADPADDAEEKRPAAPTAAPASPKAPKTPPKLHDVTALVGADLFDGTGAAVIEDSVVVLEKDRIKAVGKNGRVEIPEGAHVVDVKGKWITPGLIDSHIHFFQSGSLYTRPDIADMNAAFPYEVEQATILKEMDDSLARMLVSGVTSVVDMGGPFWNYDVRDEANENPLITPNFKDSASSLLIPKRFCNSSL